MSAFRVFLTMVLVFGVAIGSGLDLLYRLGYAILAVLAISFVWARLSMRGLEVRRQTPANRATVGDWFEEHFVVRNASIFPKLWVEVHDASDLPGHAVSRVLSPRSHSEERFTVRTHLRRRGRYSLGPLALRTGDPFGLFPKLRVFRSTQQLVVYPAIVPLSNLAFWGGELPGGATVPRWTQQITPNAAGIREYCPGDSMSRIHWPSTARTNRLIVKEFEPDPTSDMWIVIDLDRRVHPAPPVGLGAEESTEEYMVAIAASLSAHFLGQGRAVGLIGYGQHHDVLPTDRGSRQQLKLLEDLAVLRAGGRTSLAEVLMAEGSRFGRHSSVIIVTPSVDRSWIAGACQLAQRGVRVAAVLIEADTFKSADATMGEGRSARTGRDGARANGNPGNALLAVGELAAVDITTFLVKRGDRIDQALATGRRLG